MEKNTMTKQDVVCTDCKSDEIILDAWAVWSTEQQEFILDETKDWTICKNCGGGEFEFIDIGEPVDQICNEDIEYQGSED